MRWLLIPLIVLSLPFTIRASENEASARARILRAPPATQPEPMQAEPDEPAAVVQGLLPQYQSAASMTGDDISNRARNPLRFLVVLPARTLLLETTVTIDGEPFEQARQRRIDRLLAELDSNPTEEPAPTAGAELATDSLDATDPTPDSPSENADASPPANATLDSRLGRYATVTGRRPTVDETRWLLAKWVDGPTILLLDDNFQRYRGAQTPAFDVLDRDIDGTISKSEFDAAQQTLLLCDENENDVVEYTEIAEVAADPRRRRVMPAQPLLIPLTDAVQAAKALRRLGRRGIATDGLVRLDSNNNGEIDPSELVAAARLEPDVTFTVAFDAHDATKSEIRVAWHSLRLNATPTRAHHRSITVLLGQTQLEFSAVQSLARGDADQISIGMINDGYPLLPALDPNQDGRLTIRELRTVSGSLNRFDHNHDDALTTDEILTTVRISVGLGPTVHRHLSDIRRVYADAKEATVSAPEWFNRMDGNKDGDLSQREFLFDAEKFKQMDVDGDGLISPAEATQAVGSASTTPNTKPTQEKAPASP